MNNYCRNCGKKIDNSKVCNNCGTKVIEKRVEELDKSLEKKYMIIFAAAILIYLLFQSIISLQSTKYSTINTLIMINHLLRIAIIIFVIYAKKKLKRSKFFNVIFWLMLTALFLLLLFIVLLIVSCEYAL